MMITKPASHEPGDVKIEFNQSAGLIRVVDPRLFHVGRRGWCSKVAEAAVIRQEVRAVRLDLEKSTCEIQFHSGPMASAMADVLATALRMANQSSANTRGLRRSWFAWRSPQPESWSLLTAFPGAGKSRPSIWKMRLKEPGLIEIGHDSLCGSKADRSRLVDGLQTYAFGLDSCRVDRWTRTLEVRFDPERFDLAQLVETAEQAATGGLKELNALRPELLPALSGESSILVTGRKRLLFLGLGGGSFALILAGLTVPGIPTVTFVILSGYYLARSSTLLHERLTRSSFFAPIIEEWCTYQGLSHLSKVKLIGLIAAAVGVSFSLVPLTPLVVAVTFVLSSGGLYTLLRLPGIEGEDESFPFSWIARSLPAPSPLIEGA
jgi:uncharacterized membrane protein YbaN (DUF454 family)